ncbi:MAG: hypothetical protein RMJ37_06500 [Spirochaetia bacterium]|nr:hypothetical protein [Spirochaetota bacterium]MCX8096388.1 hypothetical protein [Spirochaetota bacterium]MDW8112964.1 hypothetical protein [Spirochaetia bacterium]
MRIVILVIAFLILLSSCSRNDFRNVELIDIKLGPNGDFAVAYYSNETVNVYSFEKLIRSFQRKAIFVSTSTNTIGSYMLITDFGFLKDGRTYVVGFKPTLGWSIRVGDRTFGYYSYVSEFEQSKDGTTVAFIYNVGGTFDGTNVVGGKFYVNVNGRDYGPYDFAYNLSFSQQDNTFYFVYVNGKNHNLKINEGDYVGFGNVIPPLSFANETQFSFAYRIGRNWFLHPTEKLEPNIYNLIVSDRGITLIFTNSNYTLISNANSNFVVDGILVKLEEKNGKYLILSKVSNGYKIYYDIEYGIYENITKHLTINDKLVFKYKSNDNWYIFVEPNNYGPFKYADFITYQGKIRIGYIEDGIVKTLDVE